jgi:hypothetical protein
MSASPETLISTVIVGLISEALSNRHLTLPAFYESGVPKTTGVSKLLERNAPINDCPISSLADLPDFCFAMGRRASDAE